MIDTLVYNLLPIFLVFLVSILYLFTRDIKLSNLQSKCVVITGCDTGFGHQLAINLDAIGLHVFAACLTQTGRQQLQAKCSDRLQTVLMDVTDTQDIQRCLELVETFLKANKNIGIYKINACQTYHVLVSHPPPEESQHAPGTIGSTVLLKRLHDQIKGMLFL